MKIGDYYVSCCDDSGIERQNPITGKSEICQGYFCQVYRDAEFSDQIDYFCLALGHELTDLSFDSLESGIREYLGVQERPEYVQEHSSLVKQIESAAAQRVEGKKAQQEIER